MNHQIQQAVIPCAFGVVVLLLRRPIGERYVRWRARWYPWFDPWRKPPPGDPENHAAVGRRLATAMGLALIVLGVWNLLTRIF